MAEFTHSTRRLVEGPPLRLNVVAQLGAAVYRTIETLGETVRLGSRALGSTARGNIKTSVLIDQIHLIGANSFPIIAVAAMAIGMVLALQVAVELSKFQGTRFVANITCVSILREFGPVFTALLLAGRAGSAMTAELGTMKITEQISALRMLGLDVDKYLLAPRIVAGVAACVMLTLIFDVVGIIGGTVMAVLGLGIPFAEYHNGTINILNWKDLTIGLIKAGVFGLIIATLGCYWGFKTDEGARGVGEYTKRSVVTSSITIILSDFFLSKILLNLFGLWK